MCNSSISKSHRGTCFALLNYSDVVLACASSVAFLQFSDCILNLWVMLFYFFSGSGIPEVRTMMDGIKMPHYLSLTNMFTKFLGLICTLAAGSTVFLGKVVRNDSAYLIFKWCSHIQYDLYMCHEFNISVSKSGSICTSFHHVRSLSGQPLHSYKRQ